MASPHTETVTGTFALPVLNKQGIEVGKVTVDAADFGGKISARLMHEAVMMYEANQRQGTHSTLRRGEVAGSTKKVFRQKGTGNPKRVCDAWKRFGRSVGLPIHFWNFFAIVVLLH